MAALDINLYESCVFIRILVFKKLLIVIVCIELSICRILGKEVSGREGGGEFFFFICPQWDDSTLVNI